MTPHIESKKEEIAPIVLMAGDPLRAKWMAENFLEDAKLVNRVRNMLAYTGTYKGKKITVMGSGMGIGSMGIYSWELFSPKYYDVKTIFRIGSCGSYDPEIKVGDVVIVNGSYLKGDYAENIGLRGLGCAVKADEGLVESAEKVAKKLEMEYKKLPAHCTDVFYDVRSIEEIVSVTGCKVVEMETYALFANAKLHGKAALGLLTVSDVIGFDSEAMTPAERETSLKNMAILGLETALEVYPS